MGRTVEKRSKMTGLSRLAGAAAAVLGLVMVAAWQLGGTSVLQVQPGLPPIAHQTAISFVLLGAALMLAGRLGGRVSVVLALLAAGFGALGVVAHLLGSDLPLEGVLGAATTPEGFEQTGQMTAAAALAVLVTGAGIVACLLARGRATIDYVASLGATAVIMLGLFGLVAQIVFTRAAGEAVFSWMPIPSAVGLVLVGLGLLGVPGWLAGRRLDHLQRTVPIVVTLATAIGTLFLWQALERQEQLQFERSLQVHAEHVAADVRAELQERKAILVRMAQRMALEPTPDRIRFAQEARLVMNDLDSLDAVVWVDAAGDADWRHVRPEEDSAVMEALIAQAVRGPVAAAEVEGELTTGLVEEGGTARLAVTIPVGEGGAGRMIGLFDPADLFADVMNVAVVGRLSVSIHDGGRLLFEDALPPGEAAPGLMAEAELPLRGTEWRVRVSPRTDMRRSSSSALPESVLLAGLMMSLLLGTIVHLFGLSRRRASLAERANAELQAEVRQRRRVEASLRRREAELEGLAARLERSNEALDRFASVVAHDLKEPLVTVGLFAEEIARSMETAQPEVVDYLTRIQGATERMGRLIESVLALSRITRSGAPFAPVDLGTVVTSVRGDLQGRLERSGGEIRVGVLPVVDGDAHQLRQLFQNLLANALKFGRAGVPPRVEVRWEPRIAAERPEGNEWCRILVADEGIGFSQEEAARLFDDFHRLPEAGAYEGHGLGLAIARRIVERHGGVIRARPGDGGGAVIEVDLPICHAGATLDEGRSPIPPRPPVDRREGGQSPLANGRPAT